MEILLALLRYFDSHTSLAGMMLLVFLIVLAGPYVMAFRLERLVKEQRQMYADNVELVRRVLTLAEEHQALVIMNTEAWSKVKEKVEDCPRGGLPKK